MGGREEVLATKPDNPTKAPGTPHSVADEDTLLQVSTDARVQM